VKELSRVKEFLSELRVHGARFEICVERKRREDALRYAMEGDWSPLAEYIRDGGLITPQTRSLLADILDGKITRPAKKIHKAKTKKRNRALVRFIFEARQRGDKHISASFCKDNSFSISVLFSIAAKIFCSWRHVSPNFSSAC